MARLILDARYWILDEKVRSAEFGIEGLLRKPSCGLRVTGCQL